MRRLNQRGDTIVEILIAIAVLSLVLAASFVLVRANTKSMRDSQEHGEAQTLVSSQLERLKVVIADKPATVLVHVPFCIDNNNAIQTDLAAKCRFTSDGEQYDATSTGYPYDVSVKWGYGDPNTSIYTVSASWDSVTGNGKSNVTMVYRLYGED